MLIGSVSHAQPPRLRAWCNTLGAPAELDPWEAGKPPSRPTQPAWRTPVAGSARTQGRPNPNNSEQRNGGIAASTPILVRSRRSVGMSAYLILCSGLRLASVLPPCLTGVARGQLPGDPPNSTALSDGHPLFESSGGERTPDLMATLLKSFECVI